MKKVLVVLIFVLVIGCVWAQNTPTVKINGTDFEIPSKYHGGEIKDGKYRLNNEFSIQCIDSNIPKHIGLWACEKDYVKNLTIKNHPVRHYCQYNEFIHDNQSHAYFASNKSIYEITWIGTKITGDIEGIIKNTPPSNISNDDFNHILDKSIDTYKKDRIDRLNSEGKYNYLESKLNSKIPGKQDDTRLKEILLTYYTS